ncbi:MAG: YggU family protein [Candidatus Aureabacteria bacterium]|nr:YggU family protein [Candidatus Auribacterota bacterium]
MNFLKAEKDGVSLFIKVTPSSPKNQISGIGEDSLQIRIKSPPEKGKANRELVSFLAKLLDVPKNSITITRGETSRRKKVFICGVTTERALKALPKAHL